MAEWKGLDKQLARLARFPAELAEGLEAQVEQEAEELAAAMRANAPVGKTGRLRRSIKVLPGRHRLSRRVVMGGRLTTVKVRQGVSDRDFKRARAKGNNTGEYDYSRAVEFGHLTAAGVMVHGVAMFFGTYRARRKAIRRRISGVARKLLKTLFPS